MSTFLMIMCFIMSFIFMQMKHPLAMGLMLLIQTCFISFFMGMLMKTFWFSYILFLIFMGGMLVLFIYVTSLSSNEMFFMSFKIMFLFGIILMLTIISLIFMDLFFFNLLNSNNEINSFINHNMFLFEDMLSLNKMYNFPTNLITLLLINYLFLTLLMAVKITKKNYGPLRPMN